MKQIQFNNPDLFAPKDAWDRLSLAEKAEMMKVAVKHGIYDLQTIRNKYNEFAEGGDIPQTDWSYDNWKKQIALHKGIDVDGDRTYDYEGFFRKYPQEAWAMLRNDPEAHFTDEFKTVYHPTFSAASQNNEGSIYSGVRHPLYNPEGLKGGTWSPDYKSFTMSVDGYRGPVSMDDRKWYLENAEDNGVQLREADGSLPIYDGVPWAGVLPTVTVTGKKHSIGGPLVDALLNEYAKGGGIHIKPENRGKFTALKKRTGHSATWFKEHGTPAQKKMAVFALNARKWKHGEGGPLFDDNLFLTGGPKRQAAQAKPAKKNRFEDMSIEELEASARAVDKYWEQQQRELEARTPEQIRQMGIDANRRYRQEHPEGGEADPALQRAADLVISAMQQQTPITGEGIRQAAEEQRQEKLDKWHDYKKGIESTLTAAELLAAGYGVSRGLLHLGKYSADRTGRTALANTLGSWVDKWDKPQVIMNTLGTGADVGQLVTSTNPFDTWENAVEAGAGTAGIIGGTNWFRGRPFFGRYGNTIDDILDVAGYGAASWDVVKNLPPLSGALDGIREQSNGTKALGGPLVDWAMRNIYGDGGETTAFTPITKPVIPKVEGDQEAVNWIANWYNNRREQLYNNLNDYDSRQVFLYNMKDRLTGNPVGRRAINHDYYDKLNNMAQYKTSTFDDLERDNTASYDMLIDNTAGYTVPETEKIYYNDELIDFLNENVSRQEGYTPKGVRIHERVHSSGNIGNDGYVGYNAQTNALEKIIKRKDGIEYDERGDTMPEIYARMMEFRYNHGLDPKKKYSKEEIQKLLDLEKKKLYRSELQRYDIETLTKALNEVAQVNEPKHYNYTGLNIT